MLLYVSVCKCSAFRDHKKVPDATELELQVAVGFSM